MIVSPSIWRPLVSRSRPAAVKGLQQMLSRFAGAHIHLIRQFSAQTPTPPSSQTHEPLRILFCGSDAFSCASLQALHNEMLRQRAATPSSDALGRIASLDVVVRPAKRTGRGLKHVVESPVKRLATELGLPVHERDTFTKWTPPLASNMIIAVSFGLFVPPRLLRAARYGGLNVHPSLLPDLHGAAPMEHAVLLGRACTGVTVQTLDETTFDGGRRLLQGTSENGGLLDARCTAADLHRLLAPVGADLLVKVLRRGLYLPELPSNVDYMPSFPPRPAPKLTKADRQVPWRATTEAQTSSTDIDRRARALGALWTHLEVPPLSKSGVAASESSIRRKRAILDDIDLVPLPEAGGLRAVLVEGRHSRSQTNSSGGEGWPPASPNVRTVTCVQEIVSEGQEQAQQQRVTLPFVLDGESIVVSVGVDLDVDTHSEKGGLSCLRIGSIKVEGDKAKPAARAIEAFANKVTSLNAVSWDVVLRESQNS